MGKEFEKEIYSTQDVARMAGITHSDVSCAARLGFLPANKVSDAVKSARMFKAADVEAFVAFVKSNQTEG